MTARTYVSRDRCFICYTAGGMYHVSYIYIPPTDPPDRTGYSRCVCTHCMQTLTNELNVFHNGSAYVVTLGMILKMRKRTDVLKRMAVARMKD